MFFIRAGSGPLGPIFFKTGTFSRRGPWARAGPLLFQKDIFWKQGPGSSSRRLFRKSCLPRPREGHETGPPREVKMLKMCLAGRSSNMSVPCPETMFSRPNGKIQVEGFSKIVTVPERKLLAGQQHQLLGFQQTFLTLEGCLRRLCFEGWTRDWDQGARAGTRDWDQGPGPGTGVPHCEGRSDCPTANRASGE